MSSRSRGFVGIFVVIAVLAGLFVAWRFLPPPLPQVSTLTSTPTQEPKTDKQGATQKPLEQKVLIEGVPFVPQAPTANWSDSRQQDGCEEAASYMAYLWATGKSAPQMSEEKEKALIEISDWEEKTFGSYHDTSAYDTAERILKGYFKYTNYELKYDVDASDLRSELSEGKIIIAPLDGQSIGNPYFTGEGPERHFLLIKGYDLKNDEFITNDNGTKRGESYRYKTKVLINSLRDYPTGNHVPITENKKAIIVVEKE